MNRSILISVLLLGLGLAGCDKQPTVVNVPAAAPGPAGPQGATGEQGSKGDTGKAAPTAPPESAK
ncbi:hypothetical protein [Lamprocystis purpurea]|jgi:hypothetical protein|uniref:hypothetical protein n=1 Tax=Lamprocystis purpurea TaxID=61598 RepID=UPI000376BC8E|nr:hypothetical protein [Lamprocystis purpurea]